ncbi:MAG: type II secretion system F family protein [Anaerolineae bacterium]
MPTQFHFHLGVPPLGVILWPLLFGLGAYLFLTGQPIGRPRPDLAERLRRLDVDERIRDQMAQREVKPIFASPWLEAILRPILDDLGRVVRAVMALFGLGGGEALERKLSVARPGVEPSQFFGEKLATGLIGLAIFPLMNALGLHPFGPWPPWAWAVGFLVGFLAPDWELERRLTARRIEVLMELPTVLDMLTIATSAGLALEQALILVARQGQGVVAQELQRVVREMALGQHSLDEALAAMADRNNLPQISTFVGHVRSAYAQGMPLVQTLSTQAKSLREQKRLRIVEEGGKASVRMLFPVALFILPILFVVLLAPAVFELMHLAG